LLTDVIDDVCDAGRLGTYGQLRARLAFELDSFLHLGKDFYVLYRDPERLSQARRAVAWLLEQHASTLYNHGRQVPVAPAISWA
jgi:hypothetical protein